MTDDEILNYKFSANFSLHEPRFWGGPEPQKMLLPEVEEVERRETWDGDDFTDFVKDKDFVYSFVKESDYYDDWNYFIVKSRIVEERVNKNYDKQLKDYNKNKEKFAAQLEEWKKLKKIYDQQQKLKKEQAELAEFERLKKKFEKKK